MKRFCLVLALIAQGAYADPTLVINANVITIDMAHPAAEAFAYEFGRFIAVGTNAQILKLKGPSSQVIDLHGMTVTPGFNDAHLHPQAIFDENSPYYRVWLGSDRVKTMDELVAALKRKAAITPPGGTINGYGYNDVTLGRHPNRHDLDKVSTTQPVMITHGSGHITVVNSFVLNEAGITKDTPDPSGGAFDRDPDGTPNGVLRESARGALEKGRRSQHATGSNREVSHSARRGTARVYELLQAVLRQGHYERGRCGRQPRVVSPDAGPSRYGKSGPRRFDDLLAILRSDRGLRNGSRLWRRPTTYYGHQEFPGKLAQWPNRWLSEAYSDRPGYFGIPPARSQEQLNADFRSGGMRDGRSPRTPTATAKSIWC